MMMMMMMMLMMMMMMIMMMVMMVMMIMTTTTTTEAAAAAASTEKDLHGDYDSAWTPSCPLTYTIPCNSAWSQSESLVLLSLSERPR